MVGESLSLVYSPEREDPGNESFSSTSIPKIKVNKSCLAIDAKGFRQGENRKIIELPTATKNFCDDIDLDRPKSYFWEVEYHKLMRRYQLVLKRLRLMDEEAECKKKVWIFNSKN